MEREKESMFTLWTFLYRPVSLNLTEVCLKIHDRIEIFRKNIPKPNSLKVFQIRFQYVLNVFGEKKITTL